MKSEVKMFFVALCLLTAISCSKDSDEQAPADEYFMRFKADGKAYNFIYLDGFDEFDIGASLNEGRQLHDGYSIGPYYGAGMSGRDLESKLLISIKSPNQIQATTYKSNPTDVFRGIPSIELQCILPIDDIYVKSKMYTGHKSIEVTLSELTIDYIKGTFSGTAYADEEETDGVLITEGEFYLKRQD